MNGYMIPGPVDLHGAPISVGDWVHINHPPHVRRGAAAKGVTLDTVVKVDSLLYDSHGWSVRGAGGIAEDETWLWRWSKQPGEVIVVVPSGSLPGVNQCWDRIMRRACGLLDSHRLARQMKALTSEDG